MEIQDAKCFLLLPSPELTKMMRGSEDFRISGMKASVTQVTLMVLVSMI